MLNKAKEIVSFGPELLERSKRVPRNMAIAGSILGLIPGLAGGAIYGALRKTKQEGKSANVQNIRRRM